MFESGETPRAEMTPDFDMTSPGARSQDSSTSLKQELRDSNANSHVVVTKTETADKSQITDQVSMQDSGAGTSMKFIFYASLSLVLLGFY